MYSYFLVMLLAGRCYNHDPVLSGWQLEEKGCKNNRKEQSEFINLAPLPVLLPAKAPI
jgi:hypothetical protein